MKPHGIYGIENIEGEALSQFYEARQTDLVDVVHHIQPIINIKGN